MTGLAYKPGPEWVVLAKLTGRHDTWRMMMNTFGTTDNKEQIMARVRMRLIGDPDFRREWRGWQFIPAEYSEMIVVNQTGAVQMHKSEVEGFATNEFR